MNEGKHVKEMSAALPIAEMHSCTKRKKKYFCYACMKKTFKILMWIAIKGTE
jgi:hypothetical protein